MAAPEAEELGAPVHVASLKSAQTELLAAVVTATAEIYQLLLNLSSPCPDSGVGDGPSCREAASARSALDEQAAAAADAIVGVVAADGVQRGSSRGMHCAGWWLNSQSAGWRSNSHAARVRLSVPLTAAMRQIQVVLWPCLLYTSPSPRDS